MSNRKPWPLEKLMQELHERYRKEDLDEYWEQERGSIAVALKSISDHLPAGRFFPEEALGVGGSGVVLRLKDQMFPNVDKALKFPRPVPGKVKLVREMLQKEISFLAELRHPGIVGINYYSTIQNIKNYQTLPYYLMEFVDGLASKKFVKDPKVTERRFMKLVREACAILAYLHTAPTSFAHLDIKPDNVLISADGRPILIDLGTCKRLRSEDGLTTVACTRSYAHPELMRQLVDDPSDENRAKGELKRSEINPLWDLWAFGLTLLDWLGVDFGDGQVRDEGIYHRLSTYTRKYYLLLAARLVNYRIPAWLADRIRLSGDFIKEFTIPSAMELSDILGRLDGTENPLWQVLEVGLKPTRSIQASPNNHVPYTNALSKVLNNRLYQRLNSVTQLGFVSQVYPGAKHSRREHSLGTYANTARIVRALYDDPYSPLFRQIVTEEDCRAVLLAALIHDIGHFPLGHELEEIDKKIFSHAELTQAMIKGEWRKKKKGAQTVKFHSLEEVFKAWQTSAERVSAILSAKPSDPSSKKRDKLLRSFFSGPVDADKLDYLLRDARATDVPYPFGIDVDRLFRCMTTIVVDRIAGGEKDVPTIGVHAKGKVAAEFLTLARYAMFSQVYWHHTVRAQKAMLFRAVEALLAPLATDMAIAQFKTDFVAMVSSLPESMYQERARLLFPQQQTSDIELSSIETSTDLSPTDAAVLSWFRDRLHRQQHVNAGLIDAILERKLFKRLWVVSYEMEPDVWKRIIDYWDRLDRASRHQVSLELERKISKRLTPERTATVTLLRATEAKDLVDQYTAGEIPWLLIDIPGNRPGADVGLFSVQEGQRRKMRKDDRVVWRSTTVECMGQLRTEPQADGGENKGILSAHIG